MPNAVGIEFSSGNIYALNNSTKNIDKYNSNFVLQTSYQIASANTGQNYSCFDVKSNTGTFVTIENNVSGGGFTLRTTSTSLARTSQSYSTLSGNITGIKYDASFNGYWMVNNAGTLYQTDINCNISSQVNLPYIAPNFDGYKGLSMVGNYLLVSFNGGETNGVYHIDKTTGNIANAFEAPTNPNIYDVAYDGTNFIFLTKNTNQLIYTNGNTLLADIYTIESNIRNNGYLYMTDDMGVTKKVFVSSYSLDRLEGHLTMYSLQLTVIKIDRG
jgi:hypothetical protein